jgi:hypothetical protein
MAIYKAREIAQMTPEVLWALPDEPMKIEFDDGVVETDARATIFSAYMFGPFYRAYPNVPALKRHHICQDLMGGNTTLDLFGRVFFDVMDAYPEVVGEARAKMAEDLSLITTIANNKLYNAMTYNLEEYVTSITSPDFLEVLDHPPIAKANAEVVATDASITHTYTVIKDELNNAKELVRNPISRAARSNLVSMGQILQVVGPRGRCTDTDSNIFRYPVLTGYAQGIQTLAGSMIESRTASKAIAFTKDPLQESQYTNRKIQLLAGTLIRLHWDDCGGGHWVPIRLQGRDLFFFAGKQYLREDSLNDRSQAKTLRESDKHLIGELIFIRTIFGCKHPDPQGVCAACYGEMAISVPMGTVIGHVAATIMCESISQILLSTKHLDTSASTDGSILSEYDAVYLDENIETNTLTLSSSLENAQLALIVQAKEAARLNDVQIINDVRVLAPQSISSLTDIKLEIVTNRVNEKVTLHVSDEARKSYMTHDLLEYIQQAGWTLTVEGDIRIDLKGWNHSSPLFELPLKQVNMLDYMYTIERFLRASDKGKTAPTLRSYRTPESALFKLYELVSSRLRFNIVHMECLVYACMIRSSAKRDYRLPLAGNATEFGRYGDIMGMRDLGAAMAYESHNKTIFNTYSFVVKDRPDHPLMAFVRG